MRPRAPALLRAVGSKVDSCRMRAATSAGSSASLAALATSSVFELDGEEDAPDLVGEPVARLADPLRIGALHGHDGGAKLAALPKGPGDGGFHLGRRRKRAQLGGGFVEPVDQQQLPDARALRFGEVVDRCYIRGHETRRDGNGSQPRHAREGVLRTEPVIGVLEALHRLFEELPRAIVLAEGRARPARPIEEAGGGPGLRTKPGRALEG